ncbi:MAG: NADH-quinone oxidoreductase subunit A [Bacteroidota bacterium]|nr:NADH-quinone oxidoreductase subunit A [Bacteroidota bacterium]
MQSTQIDFIPILIQILVAAGFVGGSILISSFLGPKRSSKNKDKNFESGIESIGNARTPFSVKYFLIAILFVLFDIEVIFMYPWAVNFKEMGADGLWKMGIFLFIVIVGLLYEMRRRALDWED